MNVDFETRLARELSSRASTASSAPNLAESARQSARRVRTRRRVGGGAAAALAVALAIPLVASLSGGLKADPSPAEPTPVPKIKTTIDITTLPQGEPPAVDWLAVDWGVGVRSVLHRTDGTEVVLPDLCTTVFGVADGLIGACGPRDPMVTRFAADGRVVSRVPGVGPVISPDQQMLAYYDADQGSLVFVPVDGGKPTTVPVDLAGGQWLQPAGFIDADTLVSSVGSGRMAGPDVQVDRVEVTRIDGAKSPLADTWPEALVTGVSAEAGLVVQRLPTEGRRYTTACPAVLTVQGNVLWRHPPDGRWHHHCRRVVSDEQLDQMSAFTPDGRHVLGQGGVGSSSNGFGAVTVLESTTGAVRHQYLARDGSSQFDDVTFEDDSHILINMTGGSGSAPVVALVRCDFVGDCELATPLIPNEDATVDLKPVSQPWWGPSGW